MNYQVVFTRYNKTKAKRLISGTWPVAADSFPDAFEKARMLMRGMRQAGIDDEMEIISIAAQGYSGTQCRDGNTIWDEAD